MTDRVTFNPACTPNLRPTVLESPLVTPAADFADPVAFSHVYSDAPTMVLGDLDHSVATAQVTLDDVIDGNPNLTLTARSSEMSDPCIPVTNDDVPFYIPSAPLLFISIALRHYRGSNLIDKKAINSVHL